MLRNATKEDVAYVVANMRFEDKLEIEALTGAPILDALATIDATPNIILALRKGTQPVAIFGALLIGEGQATVFRFATPRWPKAVREAIRFGRRVFLPKLWAAGINRLEAVTLDNPPQTAWLRLFGAWEVEKFERNMQPFVRFAVEAPLS